MCSDAAKQRALPASEEIPDIPGFEDAFFIIERTGSHRGVQISVHAPNHVRIVAPHSLPIKQVSELVRTRKRWIRKRLDHIIEAGELAMPKRFVPGEPYLFLGSIFRLDIKESGRRVIPAIFDSGVLSAHVPLRSSLASEAERVEKIQKSIVAGYKHEATLYLGERISELEEVIGLRSTSLSIRSNRTRWGSCSHTGTISLNWKVMAAEPEIIDYLIIHELCHLKYKSHGPRFWGLIDKYVVDAKACRKRLNEISYLTEF